MSQPFLKPYHGNINLLRLGSKIQWTKEMLLDLEKCIKDPIYFAEKHFKIVHVDDGLIPFKLWDFQKEIIKSSISNRNIIFNASRQVGKTSVATVIILHHVLFQENKTVALLANKADTAREILHRIQLAYEHLPIHLKGAIVEWNKGSVEFENGSRILASASSADNVRGQTCVAGDTIVTVRNKKTGVIENISCKELTSRITNTSSSINNAEPKSEPLNEFNTSERLLYNLQNNKPNQQEDLYWVSFY